MKKLLLSTALATGTMVMAAMPAHAESNTVWTGVSVMEDSYYAYIGGVKAFNGDLDKDGILIRGSFGFGAYQYDTVAVAGGEVEADQLSGDLMIGYQWVGDSDRFAIYVGGSVEDHDLEQKDPNNGGSEGGLKVQADGYLDLMPNVKLSGLGSYSTAFETYYTNASLTYDFGMFEFGPEAGFLGNKGFNQNRYGAKLGVDLGSVDLTLNGGLAVGGRDDDDSAYGGLSLAFSL
jgi:hypothetical protein